jgi:nucleoside 2-deoxyribosyltransferase
MAEGVCDYPHPNRKHSGRHRFYFTCVNWRPGEKQDPPTTAHVYVAGPISSDPEGHARKAMEVGAALLDAGLNPFVPHLSVWWEKHNPQAYERWMAWDFAWLSRCDALLRLPGHSPGADREVAYATERGIPVFHSIADVVAWEGTR